MKALRLFGWMVFLTGIVYPFLITGIATLTLHQKSQGSMIVRHNKVIGSLLIGQQFENEKYFWPRPSAVHYNPLPSGGSNLAPTSAKLQREVAQRRALIASKGYALSEIPSELLFASGSGLDPHITLTTALFQVERVAQARNVEKGKIVRLIYLLLEKRRFGFLGVPRVNVLQLNTTLDDWEEKR